MAKEAEKKHRRDLEIGYNNISEDNRGQRVLTLKDAAKAYSTSYALRHTPKSARYSDGCIKHLLENLGGKMLIEITDTVVEAYQLARLKEGAANKTINEEVGELLRIMGDAGDVVRLKLKKAKKLRLRQRADCGRALTPEEENRILYVASKAKSPTIYPVIVLALNTGMRDSEMRNLRWAQIDFFKQSLTVGKSKTAAGTGRTIPLNGQLLRTLTAHRVWYEATLGDVRPDSYVFPGGKARHYNPSKPMVTLKTAWRNVLRKADVKIRLHDLRHTTITKLAESGAGDETIMAIAGHVSRAMLRRYAHIRTEAKRKALEAIATQPRYSAELISVQEPTPEPSIN